ncbi:hypothetical protein EJ04DRAFT_29484 [Polyplosphaeria fusca]|uniref:Uncharacterized protein n=1 Tax=Polyplosphaeria fusca TaxID=682080 RepID=A0A9P4V033_9PLEO|nr:hypothetical protein EJ04DRAFT_29484 [Polyplosphaeria fusca]
MVDVGSRMKTCANANGASTTRRSSARAHTRWHSEKTCVAPRRDASAHQPPFAAAFQASMHTPLANSYPPLTKVHIESPTLQPPSIPIQSRAAIHTPPSSPTPPLHPITPRSRTRGCARQTPSPHNPQP